MLLVFALLMSMLPVAAPAAAVEYDTYPVLELDQQTTVSVSAGTQTYLAFVPHVTHMYEFHSVYGTSSGSSDTYGYLYDSEFNLLSSNDDGYGNAQFQIKYRLEAGKTYYLGVKFYGSYNFGSFDVMATMAHAYEESVEVPATCTEAGVKRYTCTDCGDSYTESYLEDHSYAGGYCTLCGAVLRASGSCGNGLSWTLEGTALWISGSGAMMEYFYPQNVPWYPYRANIRSVSVESGVRSICSVAFYEYTGLTQCQLPDTVTSIGSGAFYGCQSLEEIVIPRECQTIGSSAFQRCSSLTRVHIPADVFDIGALAFAECSGITELTVAEGNRDYFAEDSVLYCSETQQLMFCPEGKTGSVVVPEGIVSIAARAFQNCTLVESVTLPESLSSIGANAFYSCSSLKELRIPDSVSSIDMAAFAKCGALERVTLPSSLRSIPAELFDYCYALEEVNIPAGVTSIGRHAFNDCSHLAAVELPGALMSISSYAFQNCTSLDSLVIPSGVTSVGMGAFKGCTALRSVTLPDNLPYLDSELFSGCASLKEIRIPATVTRIYEMAFLGCASLEEIAVPDTVTHVGVKAFSGCSALTDFVIPASLRSIHAGVFENCSALKEITLPANVESVAGSAFYGCTALTAIHVHADNQEFFADNGILYEAEPLALVRCPAGITGTVVILDGTTRIYDDAFSTCNALTDIDIPYSVTCIDTNAFAGCTGLTEVELPQALEQLNWYAFQDCTELEQITVPANVRVLSSVSHYSYNASLNCTALQSVTFQGNAPTINRATFLGDSFTAYYPGGNTTWNQDNLHSYDGDVTWVPFGGTELVALGSYETSAWELTRDGTLTISGTGLVRKGWNNNWDAISTIVVEDGITGIGDNSFTGAAEMSTVRFLGDAPAFEENAFADARVIAIYPAGNNTWTEAVLGSYGGDVIWTTGSESELLDFGQCGDDVRWELAANGTLTFTGEGDMWDYTENQPEWNVYRSFIREVVVEEGVSSIGDYALNDCGSLVNVQLPDSVFNIGYCSFWNCGKLTQVELPAQLDSIDGSAFQGSGLTSIEIPASVTDLGRKSLGDCADLSTVGFNGDAPSFGENVFANDTLTAYYPQGNDTWTADVMQSYGGNVTWSSRFFVKEVATGWSGNTQWTLTDDGTLTVYGQGNMKNYDYSGGQPWLNKGVDIISVIIEEGVTSVGSGAFRNLTTLESVVLPETLTRMGEAAFYGSGLKTVEIPASLWTIQPYTFKNCTNLTSVTFHEGNLEKISDGAFYGTGLTELVLPDCLDILDVFAFKGCDKLTDITIGSGLTELREAVFYGTAIPTIEIPEGITKIGPYAFKNCVALETIELPESLTLVDEASFYACTALKAIHFPDAVKTIGNYAFRMCESIEELTFGTELETIGECAFYGCTGLTELVIPDKVTTIQPYAFKTCTGLTSVVLGEGVQTIAESAFHTCTGLKTIVFPASLTVIGDYCFSGSENLWKLTFQGDAPAIGSSAFKSMAATAYYPAGNATWTSAVMQNYGGKITWKAQ